MDCTVFCPPSVSAACLCQVARCSASAPGLVLDIPGFEGGLLSQPQRFHRRRRAAMITLKLDR
jgi:hypothetical protein